MSEQKPCPCCGAPDPVGEPCACDWRAETIVRCRAHQPMYEAAREEVALLRAENERLRDEAAVLRTIIDDRRKFSLSDEALIKRLDAENERLRAALRSFANRANWTSDGVWNAMDDPWEVARQVLEVQP